jgi:hypothetical protein
MFERLTIRTDICVEPENNIVYNNPNDPEGMYNILDLAECLYSGGEAEAGILMEISRRLAAYEDSGLSPDEVQELAKAKADGRLMVLPCKVGDTVYAIHNIPNSDKKVMVEVQADLFFIVLSTCEGRFGKTVFLTREAAEKALEGASHDT